MCDLPVLGWKEQVVLPQWGIRVRGKLDTGARSSALHVERLEVVGEQDVDGEPVPVVNFDVLVGSRDAPDVRSLTSPTVGRRRVRDTGAKAEDRYVIRTRIVCGPVDTEADVTLTSRAGMNFRMLLGRLTLEGHCVVDPARGYLHTDRPPKRTASA